MFPSHLYNESNALLHSADAPFGGTTCDISSPHSNGVVDFDGDCLGGTRHYQFGTYDVNDVMHVFLP